MFISLLGSKGIVILRKLDLFHPVAIRRRVAFNTYVKIKKLLATIAKVTIRGVKLF